MNYSDIIALALRNLRQSKLRTALTVIGVIVGVAAIITMVSFGIGLQRNIIGQAFARLDAFTLITVLGADAEDLLALSEGRTVLDADDNAPPAAASATTTPPETSGAAIANQTPPTPTAPTPTTTPTPTGTPRRPQRALDDETIAEIGKLAGVGSVLPQVTFSAYTRYAGRTRMQNVGGALTGADPRLKTFLAGRSFTDERANEAVIQERMLAAFSAEAFQQRRNRRGNPGGPFQRAETKSDEERQRAAQAALGQEIILFSQPVDEAASAAGDSIFGIPLLALPTSETTKRQQSENDGTVDPPGLERRIFRVVGVLKNESGISFDGLSSAGYFIPLTQAKPLRLANLSPMERMGGALTGQTAAYRALEVRVSDPAKLKTVSEQINALGLRAFSVTAQLEEIERVFLIINSSLALLGGIALLVASFGISNTMIMSIRERTREIGIMKAIGGSDGEIMKIFFVEASLIGLLGGALGVLAGWGIGRIANSLANVWIARQAGAAMRHVEFFSIPWYLALGAILFAVLISLLAAVYPASRAAKVDPIKALRYE